MLGQKGFGEFNRCLCVFKCLLSPSHLLLFPGADAAWLASVPFPAALPYQPVPVGDRWGFERINSRRHAPRLFVCSNSQSVLREVVSLS